MSFAEQLALATRKKNRDIATAIASSNNSSPFSETSSNNNNNDNAALSFTDRINKSASTPTASPTFSSDVTISSAKITPPVRRPPQQPVSSSSSSVASSSFADELQKKSQGGRRKKITFSNSNIVEEQASRNTDDSDDDDDDEYSSVGFSLKSSPKREEISTASHITSKKRSSGNIKKLKPVRIVPSDPSMGEQHGEGGNSKGSLPQSQPPQYQHQQQQQQQQQQRHQLRNVPQHQINQSHNKNITDNSDDNKNKVFGAWAQIESLKRRVQEAEERARQENRRAEKAKYELELVRDNRSTPTISNIDTRGKSIHVDDENDDDVTAKGGADSAILSPLSVPSQNNEVDEWRKRALEAEERLLAQRSHEQQARIEHMPEQQHLFSPQQQQQQRQHLLSPPLSSTQSSVSTTPRGVLDEESSIELIRLKNAEIDVLRSQIHRLERRIQEECSRTEGEDLLTQQRRRHYHFDGSASSCTGPPSVVGDDVGRDELRLLRNEIQNLQHQLRRQDTATTNNLTGKSSCGKGNNTSASTTGSTLSSLDENENHYDEGEEEVDDDEEDGGGGGGGGGDGCCSSWGLCCVRRRPRRRGYGRV